MKRKTFALLFALLLAALLPAASLAAQFTIGTTPERLEGAGTVTLNITMQNDGSAAMENIVISGPGVNYAASSKVINPGESMFFPLTGMAVSQDMLGQPLTYTVSWTENGESRSKQLTTSIGYANELSFSADRTADKKSAVSGDVILLTYTIKNTGTMELCNVKITDKKLARSTPVATAKSIQPGETFTATYEYKMRDSTVVSKPVITYTTGSDKTERTYSGISELSLGLINSQLTIKVTQGETGPDGTPFTLHLENNGNQTLKKLVVTDDLGNRLNEQSFALAIGEERTFEYLATTDSSREVRFTISGVDGAGLDYEEKTDRYEIHAYINPSLLGLSFQPTFVTGLDNSGKVTMRFDIVNNGSVDMTNAVLSEEQLGVIKELGTIVPGTDSFETELDIGNPRQLTFTLSAKDPVGNQRIFTAYITASFVKVSSAPSTTPNFLLGEQLAENESSGSGGTLGNTLLILCIVLGVFTLIAVIALITLTKKDKMRVRQYSRTRSTAESRRRAENAARQQHPAQRPRPQEREVSARKGGTAHTTLLQQPRRESAQARPAAERHRAQQRPVNPLPEKPVQNSQRQASRKTPSGSYAPRPYNPGRSFTEESTTRAYPRADSAVRQSTRAQRASTASKAPGSPPRTTSSAPRTNRTEVRRVRPMDEDNE